MVKVEKLDRKRKEDMGKLSAQMETLKKEKHVKTIKFVTLLSVIQNFGLD